MKSFDVFFYHINEPYALVHLNDIKTKVPNVRILEGHGGVQAVFKEMAKLSRSSHFFTVDADNIVDEKFNWYVPGFFKEDLRIHVWRCFNPMTRLSYGHGAIKLWPKKIILESSEPDRGDFTCAIATEGFCIQQATASYLNYFVSEYSVWSQAFKECFKLAAGETVYFGTQADPVTYHRLNQWINIQTKLPYYKYSIHGARLGTLLGTQNKKQKLDFKKSIIRESRFKFENIKDIDIEIFNFGKSLKDLNYKIDETEFSDLECKT